MSTNMNLNSDWMRGGFSKNTNAFPESTFEENNENTLKYSKEFMLGIYKPSPLPSDFQHHEYVTVQESLSPLAFDELSELEKKLLAGPVHVEGPRRMMDKRHKMGHDNNSPLAENGPNRFSGRKGRDYFSKEPNFRRNDINDVSKKRDTVEEVASPFGKPDDEVPWSKNGLFKDEPSAKPDFPSDLNGTTKKPQNVKWFYRDPSGQVQGPFEASEMQEWYKAGFFSPTLLIRREDQSVFEPLMVIIQKVGNEEEPFLASRPPTPDLFGPPQDGLFGRSEKYMPFGMPTTPGGGSIVDNFLAGSANTPLYQSPYGFGVNGSGGNSLLRDNLWYGNSTQSLGSPSWISQASTDLFGNPGANPLGTPNGSLGLSPFIGQQQQQQPQQQQPNLNLMFGSNGANGGLFDYHRAVNEQMNSQQQYLHMLKQQQSHQSPQPPLQPQVPHTPFQHISLPGSSPSYGAPQQLPSEPVFEPERVQTPLEKPSTCALGQTPLKNLTLEHLNSNHASPVLRANNILSGGSGWGSAPGTPLALDTPPSPWGTIGTSALPSKVTDELQSKAPGTQSPRVPSSPKRPSAIVEKPKMKSVIESFADIQLEEMERRKEIKGEPKEQPVHVKEAAKPKVSTVVESIPKPAIVSLRDIQEEEIRIAKEKKSKQPKSTISAPTWVSHTASPVVNSPNSVTWSQPALEKPLSLREIQEMEAKKAQTIKKEPEATWVAVAPKVSLVTPTASTSAAWTSTSSTPKKTLREIQQEEELVMKKKNAKAAAAAAAAAKAEVANQPSKPAAAVVPAVPAIEGWTTVSHVRLPKPATPAPAPTPVPIKEPTRWEPVKPAQSATPVARGPSDDFRRWCRKALRGLNSGVNEEEILDMLLMFPMDSTASEIIEDVIYANSLRIDGKRFAQEFMRRRKADIAGRLDIVTAGLEDDDDDDFKVVTKKNKKKTAA